MPIVPGLPDLRILSIQALFFGAMSGAIVAWFSQKDLDRTRRVEVHVGNVRSILRCLLVKRKEFSLAR